MASKQKSGLYRTKIKIGIGPDEKPIYKYVSGKTKRELEDAKRDAISYYIDGAQRVDDKLFGQCANEWFDRLRLRVERGERSQSTLDSYRSALNKEILPVFANRNMRAIRSDELQSFVDQFAGKSQTKITYITAALDNIFQSACVAQIIDRNPFEFVVKPAAAEVNERRALTDEERSNVIRVCNTHKNGAYLACMYYLGARPGEVRGLKWKDIDWNRGVIHIERDIDYKLKGEDKVGALKNKKSNRYVPMPEQLCDILRPLQGEPEGFLFRGTINGSALAKTTAERMWVELMLDCGMAVELPEGANGYRECDIRSKYKPVITPHTMRHNYVTMCWESGVDVYTASKLVGHKSIKTTMDIYTHLSERQMDKAILEVASMFGTQKKLHKSCTNRSDD